MPILKVCLMRRKAPTEDKHTYQKHLELRMKTQYSLCDAHKNCGILFQYIGLVTQMTGCHEQYSLEAQQWKDNQRTYQSNDWSKG